MENKLVTNTQKIDYPRLLLWPYKLYPFKKISKSIHKQSTFFIRHLPLPPSPSSKRSTIKLKLSAHANSDANRKEIPHEQTPWISFAGRLPSRPPGSRNF
jgi:hypothetical protein